jgi:transposase InsO family protein
MARIIFSQKDDFTVTETGVLCKKQGDKLLLCLPPVMADPIIYGAHNLHIAGHPGRTKTIYRLREHYWWWTLEKDVAKYIARCPQCLMYKTTPRRVKQLLGGRPFPEDLWQVVHMDAWHAKGACSRGFTGVLAFIDIFSKYLVLVPVKQHRALDVATAIIMAILFPYGAPRMIVSDGAPEFRSAINKEFFRIFGLKHHIVTPYRPQANGQIERIFRTIRPMLAAIAEDKPRRWSQWLPYIAFAYNTSYHRSIQNTPFFLMFGRDASLGFYTLLQHNTALTENFVERIEKLLFARRIVANSLENARENAQENYNRRTNPKEFKEQDVVYLEVLVTPSRTVKKLYPRYVGPYRIKKISGPTIGVVPLEHPLDTIRFIHSDRAKLCDENVVISALKQNYLLPFRNPTFSEDPNLDQSIIES